MRAPQQSAITEALVLDRAITEATDALARQPRNLPAFMARRDKRALVDDPMIDSGSGQQTAQTGQIEEKLGTRLTSNPTQLPVLPFELERLAIRDDRHDDAAAEPACPNGLDTTPTPYDRDSPVLVKDKVVDGYIATSQTKPGRSAAKDYFERLATAKTINEATAAYNTEEFRSRWSFTRARLRRLRASSCAR